MIDIFESAVRSTNDMAGVFEYDGDSAYFYLYKIDLPDNKKIVGAISIALDSLDVSENDVVLQWDSLERYVSLWLKGDLWGVFDVKSYKSFGGKYLNGSLVGIPDELNNYLNHRGTN